MSVCERVPDGVLQVGFQTDVSNGLLFFLIQLAQGFLNAASLFWPSFFSFSPTLLFALDEKDVGPSTCCYLILAMRFHCVWLVCTRALTAMFALSVLTPNPLCKCPETRLSSSPSRLSLMETRSFHGDRESVTVNSPALSRADQINTGPRNRPMRM